MKRFVMIFVCVVMMSAIAASMASASSGVNLWHYAVGFVGNLLLNPSKPNVAPAAAVTVEARMPNGKPFKPVSTRQQLEVALTKGIMIRVKPGIVGKYTEWMAFTVDGVTMHNQIAKDGIMLVPVKAPRAEKDQWAVVIDTALNRFRYAHPLETNWHETPLNKYRNARLKAGMPDGTNKREEPKDTVWYDLPMEVGGIYTFNFISEAGEMVCTGVQISIEGPSLVTDLLTDPEYREMVAAIGRSNGQAVWQKIDADGVIHYFAGDNPAGWAEQQGKEKVSLPPPPPPVSDTTTTPPPPVVPSVPAPSLNVPAPLPSTTIPKTMAMPVDRPVTKSLDLIVGVSDKRALVPGGIVLSEATPYVEVIASGDVKGVSAVFARGDKIIMSNCTKGGRRVVELSRSDLTSGVTYELVLFGTDFVTGPDGQMIMGPEKTMFVKVQ